MASIFYIPSASDGDYAELEAQVNQLSSSITSLQAGAISNATTFSTVAITANGVQLDLGCNSGTEAIQLGCSGSTQVINLGSVGGGETTINVGGPGDTVLIQGTNITNNTTTLDVTDKYIILNKEGTATSGGSSGIKVEENGVITGHVMTSTTRDAWELKVPSTGTVCGINQSLKTTDSPTFNVVTAAFEGTIGGSTAANIHAATVLANAATSFNTADTIVKRDSTGNIGVGTVYGHFIGGDITADEITATQFNGPLNGNSSTTTTIPSLSGDVSSSSNAITITSVGSSTAANVHAATVLANAATSDNTASTIVKRNSSGNFTGQNIVAEGAFFGSLVGNSGSCTTIPSLSGNVSNSGNTITITSVGGSSASDVNSGVQRSLASTTTATGGRLAERDSDGDCAFRNIDLTKLEIGGVTFASIPTSYSTCVGHLISTDLTGTGNTLIGNSAGLYATSGMYNTCVGQQSGTGIEAGTGNTCIGAQTVVPDKDATYTEPAQRNYNICLGMGAAVPTSLDNTSEAVYITNGGTFCLGSGSWPIITAGNASVGSANTLPAVPAGYLVCALNGTQVRIPYYSD